MIKIWIRQSEICLALFLSSQFLGVVRADHFNRVFEFQFWAGKMSSPLKKSKALTTQSRLDRLGSYESVSKSDTNYKACFESQREELLRDALTNADSLRFLENHRISKVEIEVIGVQEGGAEVFVKKQSTFPVSVEGDLIRIRAILDASACRITQSDRINKSFLRVSNLEERMERWQTSIPNNRHRAGLNGFL